MAKKPKKSAKKGTQGSDGKGVNRVKTGIKGFDELVEGGVPKGSFVLLSGVTGTGKSIFGMNFLVHGANSDEPGLYISLEEGYEANKVQMNQFGWDLDALQKSGKLLILQPKIYDFDKLVESIQDSIVAMGAKRVVIDSISVLQLYFEDKFKTRRNILDLAKTMKGMGVTTVAICEVDEESMQLSREGVEEFVSDGVVVMHLDKKENFLKRAISIRKMRATNHSLKIHPVQIKKPTGMIIYPFEETFEQY